MRLVAGPICAALLLSPVVSPQPGDDAPQQRDTPQQRLSEGPVQLALGVDAAAAKVAEPITLRLRVDAPPGTSVTFPPWGQTLGELSVVDSTVASELPLPGMTSMRRWLVTVRLESLQAGEMQILPLEVLFRLPDSYAEAVESPAGVLRTRPMTIQIQSVLEEQEDPSQFRDIKDRAPLPQPGQQRSSWPWWVGATLLLATACGVLWSRRRRPPAAKSWALDEVARLESQYEAHAIQIGETYALLSAVIREYLEAELSIPATSQSSQELCSELQRASCPESALTRLKQFMSQADELKFSGKLRSGREQADSPFDAIRAIILESSHDQPSSSGRESS